MLFQNITVQKTARYAVIGDPQKASHILFALHGYGQSVERFADKFDQLERHNTCVVIPEGLHRFYTKGFSGNVGASWMTSEDRETDILDYVNYLNQLAASLDLTEKKVHLLGFSQGAATACRWLASGRIQIQNLILWAGLVPPDINPNNELQNIQATQIWLATSLTDEFRNEKMWEEQLNLLNRFDLKYRSFEYEGGHRIPKDALVKFWTMNILGVE